MRVSNWVISILTMVALAMVKTLARIPHPVTNAPDDSCEVDASALRGLFPNGTNGARKIIKQETTILERCVPSGRRLDTDWRDVRA